MSILVQLRKTMMANKSAHRIALSSVDAARVLAACEDSPPARIPSPFKQDPEAFMNLDGFNLHEDLSLADGMVLVDGNLRPLETV
jgi:hypothetical protein